MTKHYKAVVQVPTADKTNGDTIDRTHETDDINELTNQIVGLANDNPGKEFTFRITATDVH